MDRQDLGSVLKAAQADPEGLAALLVVELGLAVVLPGALQGRGYHVTRQHLHHHGGKRVGQQVHGLARFQFKPGFPVGFYL